MRIIFLNRNFYDEHKNYKELAKKENRPYILLIICYNDIDFGIPFRSNISHKYSYIPVINTKSGLDFTKAVIVDEKYIDRERKPIIRKEEFILVKKKEFLIRKKFVKYIEDYKKAYSKIESRNFHLRNENLCKFSTLQNYHKELGL